MKDYDAFLFDWDGTLTDTLQIWIDVIQNSLHAMNISLPMEAIILGLGDWDDMIPFGFPKERMPEFAVNTRTEAKKRLLDAPLYPGARETLELLKSKGKKIALVTASHGTVIPDILSKKDLNDYFDVVITGSDITHYKPDPEAVLLALKALGNPKKETVVMIGDSPRDIQAAKNAGIDSILFNPPSHDIIHDAGYLKDFNPVLIVDSWEEFQEQAQR